VFQLEPSRTPYDLNFQFAGVPIRVHPLFWLATAILGASSLQADSAESNAGMKLLVWLVVVFVSILIHELGHAFVMRYFGEVPHVVLYLFGGLAISDPSSKF